MQPSECIPLRQLPRRVRKVDRAGQIDLACWWVEPRGNRDECDGIRALRKPARFEFDGGRRRCTEFRATEAAERDGPGGAYVLPRQAGTRDAPDVRFQITPVVDAHQERTDRWISEQSGPGPVQGGRRR